MRHGATSLDLIAESHTGLLARRAERFSFPIAVWYPVERTLLPAVAEPLPAPPPTAAAHLEVRDVIEGAGATLDGRTRRGHRRGPRARGVPGRRLTDVRILRRTRRWRADQRDGVARSRSDDGTGVIVEVGVGGPDREAFRIIHGDLPTVDRARRGGRDRRRPSHAGCAAASAEPARPGTAAAVEARGGRRRSSVCSDVEPAEPPLPRQGLNEVAPCVASGVDDDGEPCRDRVLGGRRPRPDPVRRRRAGHDRRAGHRRRCPARDLVPITRDLAALLRDPVTFATVD